MTVINLIIRGFTRAIRKDQTIPRTHTVARERARACRDTHTHTHIIWYDTCAHAWRKFRASAFTSSISSLVLHGRLNVELLILLARGTSKTTVRSTAGCLNKGTFAVLRGSVVLSLSLFLSLNLLCFRLWSPSLIRISRDMWKNETKI